MVTTIKNEKYLSIEECIKKIYTFTKGKIKLDKQHFVALIKTYENQGIDFKKLNHKMHLRVDVFENLMMGVNRYDFINRATNLYEKQIGYKEQVVAEPTYKDNENDMESYSNNLIDKYQFENKKTIKLTESQVKKLFENICIKEKNILSLQKEKKDICNMENTKRIFENHFVRKSLNNTNVIFDDNDDNFGEEEFYEIMHKLTSEGAATFNNIKDLFAEHPYAVHNSEKLQKYLQKIEIITQNLENLYNDR